MREEIEEQLKLPLQEFTQKVKCCYNCTRWQKDATNPWERMFNKCIFLEQHTPYDFYCDGYSGNNITATQENLITQMTNEEIDEYLAADDAMLYPPN